MPGFPFPGRPGGEHDEPLLDMIIARRALPPDAPYAMHDLARMLAALAGPAEPGELAGEAAVRAAFSRAASPAGVSSAARRPVRHRRPRRSRERSRSRVRLATVMVVAAAGLGSVLAAYIDVLPSPIQRLAHVAVAAPAWLQLEPARHAGDGAARAPQGAAVQPIGPRAAPLGERRCGPQHADHPDATLPAAVLAIRLPPHRPGLQPPPGALAAPAAEGIARFQPAAVLVSGAALYGHPHRPGRPAHAEPLRALTRPRPGHPGCIRAA